MGCPIAGSVSRELGWRLGHERKRVGVSASGVRTEFGEVERTRRRPRRRTRRTPLHVVDGCRGSTSLAGSTVAGTPRCLTETAESA